MESSVIADKKLCVTLCLLCGSLCNKKKLHRITQRRHREHGDKIIEL